MVFEMVEHFPLVCAGRPIRASFSLEIKRFQFILEMVLDPCDYCGYFYSDLDDLENDRIYD
jgi:hypothetical protein